MDGWGEWRRVIESDEDTDIKELIFCYPEFLHEAPLRGILKGRVRRSQIEGGNQLVHARVEKGICRSKNGMNIRFLVTLEVYQLILFSLLMAMDKLSRKQTYLSPSDIWGNEEFDIPVSKDPQYHPPKIPLGKATPAFEQLGGSFFLALFVPCPCLATVFACVDVFCVMLLLPPFVG